MYDKGNESGDAPDGFHWRVEAELKREYAEGAWACLTGAESGQIECLRLLRWSLERSRLPWLFPQQYLASSVAIPKLGAHGDVLRAIEWLKSAVSPTIARLAKAGYLEEAIEALAASMDTEQRTRLARERGD